MAEVIAGIVGLLLVVGIIVLVVSLVRRAIHAAMVLVPLLILVVVFGALALDAKDLYTNYDSQTKLFVLEENGKALAAFEYVNESIGRTILDAIPSYDSRERTILFSFGAFPDMETVAVNDVSLSRDEFQVLLRSEHARADMAVKHPDTRILNEYATDEVLQSAIFAAMHGTSDLENFPVKEIKSGAARAYEQTALLRIIPYTPNVIIDVVDDSV